MAAGQGFKTFTTGEVLSASDVNGYLMQGVLVFASAAARDAAITSPQEGQYAYLKDTNATFYYSGSAWVSTAGASSPLTTKGDLYTYSTTDARLGVGANDTVLTADSTAATGLKWAGVPAASTSWSLLNSGGTALTAAGTITVSGLSSFNKFFIIIDGASSDTAGATVSLRFNSDSASNYKIFGVRITAASTYDPGYFESAAYSLSSYRLSTFSNNAGSDGSGYVSIDGAKTTGIKMITSSGAASASTGSGAGFYSAGGYWNNTATISSISVLVNFGNFDGGTMFIYGAN